MVKHLRLYINHNFIGNHFVLLENLSNNLILNIVMYEKNNIPNKKE